MARAREAVVNEEDTILGLLPKRLISKTVETYTLFCGQRSAGKSSLLGLLQQGQETKELPKATVALEYVFARRTKASGGKDVAHIWELGSASPESVLALCSTVLTPERLSRSGIGVVVDLSSADCVVECATWLERVKALVRHNVDILGKDDRAGADAISDKGRKKLASDHADRRTVDAVPVPLVICATRYDIFRDQLVSTKKVVAQALRFLAHHYGASLMFTSSKDKPLQTAFRNYLSAALFFKPDKQKAQLNPEKGPIVVPVGTDELAAIEKAGPLTFGERSRARLDDALVDALIVEVAERIGASPDTATLNRLKLARNRTDFVVIGNDDIAVNDDDLDPQFAEPVIDKVYKQKMEELARYRKKIEQRDKENLAEKLRQQRAQQDRLDKKKKLSSGSKSSQHRTKYSSSQASSSAPGAGGGGSSSSSFAEAKAQDAKVDDAKAHDAK